MRKFSFVRTGILGLLGAALPAIARAQAYGQSTYGNVAYSNGVIQIGPITLPNTGTTWATLILGVLAIVTAVLLYRRAKHKPTV